MIAVVSLTTRPCFLAFVGFSSVLPETPIEDILLPWVSVIVPLRVPTEELITITATSLIIIHVIMHKDV